MIKRSFKSVLNLRNLIIANFKRVGSAIPPTEKCQNKGVSRTSTPKYVAL